MALNPLWGWSISPNRFYKNGPQFHENVFPSKKKKLFLRFSKIKVLVFALFENKKELLWLSIIPIIHAGGSTFQTCAETMEISMDFQQT